MWTLLDRIEAPTWLVAIAIYGGWGLLTWYGTVLPWWLVLPAGAWLVAWHNSLQHETIHGHPTRDAVVNEAIALPPLGLWLPYPLYRDRHRRHHATSDLTVPDRDPESDYLTPRRWNAMGAVGRALWRFNRCLAGRLTIGPAIAMVQFWGEECRRLGAGDRRHLGIWLSHGVLVSATMVWITGICGMSLWSYVVLFAYPGLSLTLLRSYTEHRAAATRPGRTAIVEAGPLLSLLYLHNNLHSLHHARPGLAWYRLPKCHRAARAELSRANGDFVFAGYGDVARQFLFRTKNHPTHPFLHHKEA